MLTQQRLKECVEYSPETGAFTWRISRRSVRAGDAAATVPDALGYLRIQIDGKTYKAHRLAYLYMTGEWPEDQVDHRDGDRQNNRWVNLRDATPRSNMENRRRAQANNSIGFLGVRFDRGAYRATIQVAGKKIEAGRFATPEQAHAAYVEAKRVYHAGGTL